MTASLRAITPRARFLILCAVLLAPLCFVGYGADNDTYGVLDSGRVTWLMHHLDTSRNPGYWLFEAIVFALSSIGGYVLTNLATLAVGLVCLDRFLRLAQRLRLPHPYLAAATLAATPVFAIACTSTLDYVWSLLGLILLAECLLAGRLLLAILPASFAFAIRGANGVVIAGMLAGAVAADYLATRRITPRAARIAGVGAAAALLAAPLYLLSFIAARHSFAFLEPAAGPDAMWTLGMRAGRFVYKLAFLFGPVALFVLIAAWFRRRPHPERSLPTFLLAGAVFANLLLFLRYPIEISYLIPAACFGLLLLAPRLPGRRWSIALLLAVLSLNFVTPQLARPDHAGSATSAHLHPSLGPGVLLENLHLRRLLLDCTDYDCYKSVTAEESLKGNVP